MQENKTINKKEIEAFNFIANQWDKSDSEFSSLKCSYPLKVDFIVECTQTLNPDPSGLRLLDVGSGIGTLAARCASLGFDTTALEPAAGPFALGAAKHPGIKWHNLPVERFTAPAFDVITCMDVIEHTADPKFFLKECFRLLKDDGLLILSTINRTSASYLLAKIAAEYLFGLSPQGIHDWNNFVKPSELAATAVIKAIQGISYNLFTKKWYKSDETDVCYLACLKHI